MLYIADNLSVRAFDTFGNFKHEYNIKPDNISWLRPFRVSRDVEGNIYVLTEANGKIQKINPAGQTVLEFKLDNPIYRNLDYSPMGLVVDKEGIIYVADTWGSQIQKFDQQGKLLGVIGKFGSKIGEFNRPMDLALDAAGNLYVNDTMNGRIQVFTKDGVFLKQITVPTSIPGFFLHSEIAVDAQGNVYVPDVQAQTIRVYNAEGNLVRRFGTEGSGNGQFDSSRLSVAVDANGNIYVGEGNKPRVQKFSPAGEFVSGFGYNRPDNTAADTDFIDAPYLVESDAVGNFFVAGKSDFIQKIDKNGTPLFVFGGSGENDGQIPVRIRDMKTDRDGNLYVLAANTKGSVHKFNSRGEFMFKFAPVSNTGFYSYTSLNTPYGIALDFDGNVYISDKYHIFKYDPEGKLVANISLRTNSGIAFQFDGLHQPESNKAIDFTVSSEGQIYITVKENNSIRIKRFDASGVFISDFTSLDFPAYANLSNIDFDEANNLYTAEEGYLKKYDPVTGALLAKSAFHPYMIYIGSKISVNASGSSILVTGSLHTSSELSISCFKDDSEEEGLSSPNLIAGSVFNDINSNCLHDDNQGMEGIVVEASPGPFYGLTDKAGKYSIAVGEGKFTVKQVLTQQTKLRSIEQLCPAADGEHTVFFNSTGSTTGNINFANKAPLVPYLSISVSSNSRRRCFPGTTTVSYSNTGFAPAENAKVHLHLPEHVVLKSADKPYTRRSDGTYVFEAGTLAAGANGTITIQDSVICGNEAIRGLTVCTKAWITPGNQPATGKATTTVTGRCYYGSGEVRFVIKNTGQAAMQTPKQYRIFKDAQLSAKENYQLAAGDSLVLLIPAEGKTLRLEADQPDGNSDNLLASATVEGCRVIATRIAFSTGFVNALPADDEEAEVAEECLPIIDSYDPNDKLVTPVGLTEENYTPTNTPLKYKIRFQNTGTDVAYRVVVVDTLSEHLDLSTLQMGTSSHNYTFSVSGKGQPVLTWTFNNILLPDSTSNEPGSHGYIQFSIRPKAELPEKTAIENFADIFFDYNSPVRTNVTVNRIYDLPQEIQEENRIVIDEILMTPAIAAFVPESGKFGAEVVVTGAKFSDELQENKVYFNGVAAEVVEAGADKLTVRVPAGATTGTLKVVTTHGGTSSSASFTVYQPPLVSSFSPIEGIAGSEVTLQGEHLESALLEKVLLGNEECQVISSSAGSVTVKVPAGATTGVFTVQSKGGSTESNSNYRVWNNPAITSFDKEMERVGGKVMLHGQNFAPEVIRNKVRFGNLQAEVLQASEQALQVRVPEGARTGIVSVTTPGGTASKTFEIIPAPLLTAVHPPSASVGTVVELRGEYFLVLGKQDTVSFAGTVAVVTGATDKLLKVRVPKGAATGKIVVAGSGGRAEAAFTVEALTPQQAIELYPNPSPGRFTVDFIKADFEVQGVQVFDATGRLVHQQQLSAGQAEKLEVDLREKEAGVYTVIVQTERGKVVKRVSLL